MKSLLAAFGATLAMTSQDISKLMQACKIYLVILLMNDVTHLRLYTGNCVNATSAFRDLWTRVSFIFISLHLLYANFSQLISLLLLISYLIFIQI